LLLRQSSCALAQQRSRTRAKVILSFVYSYFFSCVNQRSCFCASALEQRLFLFKKQNKKRKKSAKTKSAKTKIRQEKNKKRKKSELKPTKAIPTSTTDQVCKGHSRKNFTTTQTITNTNSNSNPKSNSKKKSQQSNKKVLIEKGKNARGLEVKQSKGKEVKMKICKVLIKTKTKKRQS
jgi:hypothetical protein